jgi:hypothetical protein
MNLRCIRLQVKTLFIYFYINYFFLCLIRWLKYSEIYSVTVATGVVRGSFPLVEQGYVFCPLLNQISNNK